MFGVDITCFLMGFLTQDPLAFPDQKFFRRPASRSLAMGHAAAAPTCSPGSAGACLAASALLVVAYLPQSFKIGMRFGEGERVRLWQDDLLFSGCEQAMPVCPLARKRGGEFACEDSSNRTCLRARFEPKICSNRTCLRANLNQRNAQIARVSAQDLNHLRCTTAGPDCRKRPLCADQNQAPRGDLMLPVRHH